MMAAIWPWCVYVGVCVCFLVCGESTQKIIWMRSKIVNMLPRVSDHIVLARRHKSEPIIKSIY